MKPVAKWTILFLIYLYVCHAFAGHNSNHHRQPPDSLLIPALKKLEPGDSVRILLQNMSRFHGRFSHVINENLYFSDKPSHPLYIGSIILLEKRINLAKSVGCWSAISLGLAGAIGFGVAVAAGAEGKNADRTLYRGALIGGLFGAGMGYGAGYVLGKQMNDWITIYKRKIKEKLPPSLRKERKWGEIYDADSSDTDFEDQVKELVHLASSPNISPYKHRFGITAGYARRRDKGIPYAALSIHFSHQYKIYSNWFSEITYQKLFFDQRYNIVSINIIFRFSSDVLSPFLTCGVGLHEYQSDWYGGYLLGLGLAWPFSNHVGAVWNFSYQKPFRIASNTTPEIYQGTIGFFYSL